MNHVVDMRYCPEDDGMLRSYTGPVDDNGLPHGDGTRTRLTGEGKGGVFRGHFVHGNITGYGEYTGKNNSFKGYYVNNKAHGRGSQTFPDGSTYEGE